MEGRTSLRLLPLALMLLSSGCVSWGNNKKDLGPVGVSDTNFTPAPGTVDPSRVKKAELGPKRNPNPKTEIAFGELKEADADMEIAKKNPEIQGRLRDEARHAYQAAVKIDPNNLDAYRHLGRLYVKMGDVDRALETYKKAMIKHPKEAALWYDLGMCHQRRKDLNESVRCFKKALELEPENRDIHKKLGFTLAWMGNFDEGLKHLTSAHGPALAHCNIARILIERNERQAAHEHVMIALRANSELPDAQGLLSWLEGPPRPISALGAPVQ